MILFLCGVDWLNKYSSTRLGMGIKIHESIFQLVYSEIKLNISSLNEVNQADISLVVLVFNSVMVYMAAVSCWSRRACVRHPWWRTKRNWPLFSPTFISSSFSFFLSTPSVFV